MDDINQKIINIALKEYGTKEIVGPIHNPEILKYFQKSGQAWVKDDETAWCSAFINYVVGEAGGTTTQRLDTRPWLNIGLPVQTPRLGNIVVFWRIAPDSIWGHVGIYIAETKDTVFILGGNQNNQVNISEFPKYRILGYRQMQPKVI